MKREFKIDLTKVRIGSDFELFLTNTGGKFISAIPFIDGTKDSPLLLTANGHAIQADGVLFEANVPAVKVTEGKRMWEDIQFVIEAGKERLPKNLQIVCCTNGAFDEEELQDPSAKIAGCTPDFSAWENGNINEKPDFDSNNDRCCGLHWHVSFPGADVKNVMRLIRIMDVNMAIPLLFVDEDRKRRKLYGKAGAFRFREYNDGIAGVEYRSLSNCVLKDPETFSFFFGQLVQSLKDYNAGKEYLPFKDRILEAVNNYNLDEAAALAEEFEVELLHATA